MTASMNSTKWLLRREFWENRGGFFWAPLVSVGVIVVFTILGIITTEVFKEHFLGSVSVGVSLRDLVERVSPEDLTKIGPGIDMGLLSVGGFIHIVLAFVLFFYLLGALYDERRDRSVLFWKSLPISDTATVVSKALTAALVAPILAFGFAIALQLALLAIMSVYVLAYGVNPLTVIWGPASPLSVFAQQAAAIPLNAIWALPTIGWLLLVSAFARSKPFLWAVLVPVGVGLFLNWFDVLQNFSLPDWTYWKHVLLHLLGGVLPNSWQFITLEDTIRAVESTGNIEVMGGINQEFGWGAMRRALATKDMWIGAVAGIAMMVGAIRLRRWREDG